jgi:hypothetical protein
VRPLAIAFGVHPGLGKPHGNEYEDAEDFAVFGVSGSDHTFLIYVAVILVIICREAFSHSGVI